MCKYLLHCERDVIKTFVVVNDMNRNVILGRDWLKENGVRIYFDLGLLRINNVYVKLHA